MFGDFFKSKRVFITGHTGFKGSWLATWLLQMGATVTGFALPARNDREHFSLLRLGDRMNHRVGDLRANEPIKQALTEAAPEIVFHLAAQALVLVSHTEPKLTFDTNVGGAVNLLEAIRECPSVRALVYITSDKCYRNKEWSWGYRENDELGGSDPYGASKACAEMVLEAYLGTVFRGRADFAAASARAGNVIGGGDWASYRIVPDFIRAMEKEQPIVVRSPQATRPWQHVLEPLSGYLLLGQRLATEGTRYSGAWNFGPTAASNRTVGELVQKALKIWGSGRAEMAPAASSDALPEAKFLHLNCDKAYQELGWTQTWHFDEGLKQTITWYHEWLKGLDAWDLTTGQIQAYMEAAARNGWK